jgi:hypothetical protein
MSFLKKNSLILGLMILVLGGAAYWFTMRGDTGEEATIVTTEQGGAQPSDNAELAQRLALLASLSIKRDIFDNPAFLRLQPNLVDVPRPVYRNQNPFAPIGQRSDRFATGTTPGLSNPVPGLGAIPLPGSATTSQIQRMPSIPATGAN